MNDETVPENKKVEETPSAYADSMGACATAATKSALTALITGEFPDPVGIILPEGDVPHFQLTYEGLGEGYATAGIAWNDPNQPEDDQEMTIVSTVFPAQPGDGISIQAGDGVSEADIDPLARQLTLEICEQICNEHQLPADLVITIAVPERG